MGIKKKIAAFFASAVILFAGAAAAPQSAADITSQTAVTASAAETTLAKVTFKDDFSSSTDAVRIYWNKVSGADGYRVYSYNSTTKTSTKLATIKNGSTTEYRRSGLKSGTAYSFKVRAYKIVNGKTVWSPQSSAKYTATRPNQVSFSTSKKGETSLTLNWKKVNGSGYRLYQKKNGKWVRIKTISGSGTTSYTVKGLSAGKSYYFKVRAYKLTRDSVYKFGEYSAVKKLTTNKASTPVAKYGQLSVKGANIVDKNGNAFKIKGMSTHGIMWETFGDILSKDSLKVFRDDWKVNTIRIAMYTSEYAGYTTSSDAASKARAKVETGVKNATDLGMYAIIDWHILSDGDPRTHQSEAVAFFRDMAKKYKDQNNIIYEICNEPNGGVSWTGGIKSYCQTVVNEIRKYDKDAIIICGTGTWSQDIDQVLGNRLSDKNCVYALHFYANTHTDWLRNRLKDCYNKGLPVIVSEFGTCDASGNGGFNEYQTKEWLKLLDSLKVGYINWSAANKSETASAFVGGTNLSAIKSGESQLTQSGKLIRSWYRAH